MSRIAGIPPERSTPLARLLYSFAQKRLGKVPEPMAVSAHSGPIFSAYVAFEMMLQRAKSVAPTAGALAGIRAATLVGCSF